MTDYSKEKAIHVTPEKLNVFGINIWSRYGRVLELTEMMNFAQQAFKDNVHSLVEEIFYDTQASICTFKFKPALAKGSVEEKLLLDGASKTIGQFEFDGEYLEGEPMKEYRLQG